MILSQAQKDVKTAIINYGRSSGFTEQQVQLAVEIAYIESSLGSNLQNPVSTAGGLYQYLNTPGGNRWNEKHSALGDRTVNRNQIKAFYNDLSEFYDRFNNLSDKVKGNLTVQEYVYIKHHDGANATDFTFKDGGGREIYNRKMAELKKAKSNILKLPAQDSDGDGVPDSIDNHIEGDLDRDGIPDTIDNDIDGDGELNLEDDTPFGDDPDGDGLPNIISTELDIDSILSLFADHNELDPAAAFEVAEHTTSPIVLDLNGDGIETLSKEQGIHFDLDNNGMAETVGWVSGEDGLLVRDINGNGTIDNGSELFDKNHSWFLPSGRTKCVQNRSRRFCGNYTQLANGGITRNGYQALADLDSNRDGFWKLETSNWKLAA